MGGDVLASREKEDGEGVILRCGLVMKKVSATLRGSELDAYPLEHPGWG